jgi:hypothetical protein
MRHAGIGSEDTFTDAANELSVSTTGSSVNSRTDRGTSRDNDRLMTETEGSDAPRDWEAFLPFVMPGLDPGIRSDANGPDCRVTGV